VLKSAEKTIEGWRRKENRKLSPEQSIIHTNTHPNKRTNERALKKTLGYTSVLLFSVGAGMAANVAGAAAASSTTTTTGGIKLVLNGKYQHLLAVVFIIVLTLEYGESYTGKSILKQLYHFNVGDGRCIFP
jgi:hypothetical protein